MPATQLPPAIATVEAQPAATPTAELTQTSTSKGFVPDASDGNLDIRRCPGHAYEVVGFYLEPRSSPVGGCNEPASWVDLAIPDKPGAST